MTAEPLTFGASIGSLRTRDEVLAAARSAEAAGFDRLNTADHLGYTSPFAVLAAAASVTERIRLRTYVLNVYFWNAALLAREVATIDALSAGRFELGLGAGHMKREHDDAGLPFPPLADRVAELERVLLDVQNRLEKTDYTPPPVQARVPVSIGAWSPGTMSIAARQAEIISLTGMVQLKGRPPGTFTLSDVPEVDERLDRLRTTIARERPPARPAPVLDCLLQRVIVDADPEQSARELVAEDEDGGFSVGQILESPFVLLAATPQDAVQELRRRQERWGITSWCTHTASTPALAEVITALRRQVP
jgi:probable F420-dependent oxidoreductase